MRGDVARIGYEGVVGWGVRALQWCAERDKPPVEMNMRHAWRELGAPFETSGVIERQFGKKFAEFRHDCMEAQGTGPAPPVAKAAPVAPDVQLGPGVTANAPQRVDPMRLLEELQDRHDRHSAQFDSEVYRTVTIELDHPEQPVGIVGMGDMHTGSPATNPKELLAIGDLCQRSDIKVFAGSVGDVLDSPTKEKLMEEAWRSVLEPEDEIAAAAMILDRIAKPGRLLFVNAGNHDLFSQKRSGYSHLNVVMDRLSTQVPYARYEMILTVNLMHDGQVRQSYKFEIRHKPRGGGMNPGTVNRKMMREQYRDIDVTLMGHTHSWASEEMRLYGKQRRSITLGSYKNSARNAYDIEHGYPHNNLYPDRMVILWPDRRWTDDVTTENGVRILERERDRLGDLSRSVQKRDRFRKHERGGDMNASARAETGPSSERRAGYVRRVSRRALASGGLRDAVHRPGKQRRRPRR